MATRDLEFIDVAPAQLTGSNAIIYAIPTTRKSIHIEAILCNTDDTTEYLPDIFFVPSGSSAGVTNQVVNGVTLKTGLDAGESRTYTWDQFLPAGTMIFGKANVASKITHKFAIVLEVL